MTAIVEMTGKPIFVFAAVLLLTLISGSIGLPLLRWLKVGQTVRDDGPKTHLIKSGTPTFGGLLFLVPISIVSIYLVSRDSSLSSLFALLLFVLSYALVGFLDDFIKVRINKKGLSVRHKSILMIVFAFAFALYYLYLGPEAAYFRLPLTDRQWLITGWIRLPYMLFIIVYLFFISNSVNLTDGVDGLASSVTVINALALALVSWKLGAAANAVSLYAALAIAAGCLGFLVYNHYPAKVFMGDTGSQALGAAVAGIALLLGMPWLLLLIGFIYIAESMSVIIQVAYFKKTGGRRIFRMSPIHHHYELGGWSEKKIVFVFSLISVIGCLTGWLLV